MQKIFAFFNLFIFSHLRVTADGRRANLRSSYRYVYRRMTNTELTLRLARATRSSRAEAADYLDQTVLSILKRLKQGECADWPGLGVFVTDLTPRQQHKRPALIEDPESEKVACP